MRTCKPWKQKKKIDLCIFLVPEEKEIFYNQKLKIFETNKALYLFPSWFENRLTQPPHN